MREYLARNVVEELPGDLREFLVETSVLRRLTGSLCDRLLDRSGSRARLEELERRSVFTVAIDDEGTFRYHEVLRSHLEGMLVEAVGEPAARARARRGGELLEADGAIAEAVAAYSRAEDWGAVDRLLDRHGERLAAGGGAWMDTLPPSLLVQDPWLILATARRHRAEGRWAQALQAYARAEVLFGSGEPGATCRRERLAVAAWLDPLPAPAADWSGVLRSAVAREPLLRRPAGDDEPGGLVAAGLGALIGGRVADARRILRRAADDETSGPVAGLAARLGAGVAGLLAGDARAVVETEQAVATAEHAGLGWIARVGRAALSIAGTPAGAEYARSDATSVREAAALEEDRWGEGLAALAEGWAALGEPEAALAPLEVATTRFRALGAGSLEAWARGLTALALARAGAPEAREAARTAEAVARSTGIAVVAAIAQRALAELEPVVDADLATAADGILSEAGIALPAGGRFVAADKVAEAGTAVADRSATASTVAGAIRVQLFGSFAMAADGHPVDLAGLKPRPRAVLRFLALNAGRPVHREVLQETFWPEADPETGARSLHVALSALRRELAPRAGRGACELLVREGDAYRLTLPEASRIDLADFEQAVIEARTIRARGATQIAIEAFRAALAAYGGDVLPEDGPAEWAAGRRDRARAEAVAAARALAELLLDGDPAGAAEACAAGLVLDSHHDPLWRLLVEARERAGDQAAATGARSGYARMLADLGISSVGDA
jgi:DNA-binding SARP family transcriptional activator/tetratricopeptide (TPR) repeat protein